MKKYDKKPLSHIIFKISSKWEAIIKRNFDKIGSFAFGLQQIVRLIIVGLTSLIFALVQLAIEYYLINFLTQTEPYKYIMPANDWRLSLFSVCLLVFVPLVIWVFKYTKNKNNNSISSTPTKSKHPE